MSSLGNKFRELENLLQIEKKLNIEVNQEIKINTNEINFNKCEIKILKNEFRNIKNKIDNVPVITKNLKNTTEVIERIKIKKKPEPIEISEKLKFKSKPDMTNVVNEFKNIDIKTHLTKVPEDVLNRAIPEANPNSYHEFIKSKKSVEA